jgi:hypothetical protein
LADGGSKKAGMGRGRKRRTFLPAAEEKTGRKTNGKQKKSDRRGR